MFPNRSLGTRGKVHLLDQDRDYWIRIGNCDIVICLFYQFRAQTDSMTCADPPSWPGGQSALNATPLRQMTRLNVENVRFPREIDPLPPSLQLAEGVMPPGCKTGTGLALIIISRARYSDRKHIGS